MRAALQWALPFGRRAGVRAARVPAPDTSMPTQVPHAVPSVTGPLSFGELVRGAWYCPAFVDSGWSGWCGVRLPPFVWDEVGDGDWLVAMGTAPTRANPAAEDVAIGAALRTEEASVTGRALVDNGGDRGDRDVPRGVARWPPRARDRPQWRRRQSTPAAPGGLPAGIRAEPPPAARGEGSPTDGAMGAGRAGYRYAIVTRRHSRPGPHVTGRRSRRAAGAALRRQRG